MNYRIVGIDPGLTTGVTAFAVINDKIECVESYELDIVGVGRFLETQPYDTLAYEVANKFQASGHMSSEVIGLAKYFGLKKGIEPLPVLQSAWKKLVTRDVLKRAGLYVKGTHAKDAAGIGLYIALIRLNLVKDVLRPEEAA